MRESIVLWALISSCLLVFATFGCKVTVFLWYMQIYLWNLFSRVIFFSILCLGLLSALRSKCALTASRSSVGEGKSNLWMCFITFRAATLPNRWFEYLLVVILRYVRASKGEFGVHILDLQKWNFSKLYFTIGEVKSAAKVLRCCATYLHYE